MKCCLWNSADILLNIRLYMCPPGWQLNFSLIWHSSRDFISMLYLACIRVYTSMCHSSAQCTKPAYFWDEFLPCLNLFVSQLIIVSYSENGAGGDLQSLNIAMATPLEILYTETVVTDITEMRCLSPAVVLRLVHDQEEFRPWNFGAVSKLCLCERSLFTVVAHCVILTS
jgi:hypothetical protein